MKTAEYEPWWNTFVVTISRAPLTDDDGLGDGLQCFTKSNEGVSTQVVACLLFEYCRKPLRRMWRCKLWEYVPARQKGTRRRDKGTVENAIVLKTDARRGRGRGDNGKRYEYRIGKAWKGLDHTEKEFSTKKREAKRVKIPQGKEAPAEESESDSVGVTIKGIHIGKTRFG